MTDVSMAEDAAASRPVHTDGPVIDLLAGNLNSLIPPRSQPTDYGGLILRGGVNAIHITLGLYSRRIEELLDELFDAYNIFDQMGDKVLLVESVADLHESYESGRVGTILGVQGLEFIQDNTKFVPILHRLGIRIATLTYNEKNLLGNGCLEPRDEGLTFIGVRMVRELRRAGILLDLSHAGDKTSLDAIEAFDGPVAFTHSNAYELTPNPRNISDDLIKAAAASGGIVGLATFAAFCHRENKEKLDPEDYFRHIDYVAELVGTEHVAIGTDMTPQSKVKWENNTRRMYPELVGRYILETEYIEGLETHADFPAIPEELRKRGYSEAEIKAILGGNFIRVCEQVWK